jgi:hypothetical protein
VAVSSAFSFSYEVEISSGDGGAFEATARSGQEAAGELPGLVGARPLVSIKADMVRFDARDLPSKLDHVLELVTVLVPPLRNWLVDRRLQRASVRRIELSVAGLCALLQRGQIIQATLELDGSGIPIHPPRATVVLLSGQHVVRTWGGVSVVMIESEAPAGRR